MKLEQGGVVCLSGVEVPPRLSPSGFGLDKFLDAYPEDGHYELVNGEIVRILATRQHEDIADFIANFLKQEVKQRNLNYKVSDRIVLATQTKSSLAQLHIKTV